MNIGAIVTATVLVALVGLFIGIFLGAAGKKFAVEVDEKEVAIREALPGNNCGGCGYPGCDGLALPDRKGVGASEPLSGRRRTGRQDHCRYYGTGSRRKYPPDCICKVQRYL